MRYQPPALVAASFAAFRAYIHETYPDALTVSLRRETLGECSDCERVVTEFGRCPICDAATESPARLAVRREIRHARTFKESVGSDPEL
jgi:hypothetical protein